MAEHDKDITIKVNNKDVTMTQNQVKGIEIKQAAIDQGVDIQLSFHLKMETEGGGWTDISDDEKVNISNKHRRVFRAIEGDENS